FQLQWKLFVLLLGRLDILILPVAIFFIICFFSDINECLNSSLVCGPNANCSNYNGNYSCSCWEGYNTTNMNETINYTIVLKCLIPFLDINECQFSPSVCGPNSTCTNQLGSYNCSCLDGFTATNSISGSNPCNGDPSVCGPNSDCTNQLGSYSCSCSDGFTATNSNLPISINNISWKPIEDNCVLEVIDNLKNKLEHHFIFNFQSFLNTVDIIVSGNVRDTSIKLLSAIENISDRLIDEFDIYETSIQLNRTTIKNSFALTSALPNSTTEIVIPQVPLETTITIIIFTTLDKVLPSQGTNDSRKSNVRINGDVVVVKVNKTLNNISFTFDITDQSLGNPQCVFWNFILNTWDSTGCEVKRNSTGNLTCECNHTTSFSILMSPFSIDHQALGIITYIGVAISMASLIICLIIETIIWKSVRRNDTSYMRHVSIVNIAVSLLIANICFIIGAAIAEQEQSPSPAHCSPVVFFMHFFYLALFFWMLLSALLLFYRTVMVLSQMSRTKMMVIAFIVGYGAPLLIAVITVASTAGPQNYISKSNACWLNWYESKALLGFVIPAFTIVAINLVVLIVVLYKMLRSGVGATTQPDEKHALVVIARCVAFLTPIFGLTWGFGIGTMVSRDFGIHVVWDSFGILLDWLSCLLREYPPNMGK
uniref:Adhesion G protein-coupled receptor F5 n=1 Tax=Cyprinus carpio TaxID=7962 RepID=A0A8C1XSY8_CYPCA